jgi:hypothetical protein
VEKYFIKSRLNTSNALKLPIHETVTIRCSTVTEEEHHLMGCFRAQRNEIPKHIWVFQVSLWVSLLSVDEAREKNWITNEEDGRVVADKIPHAVIGVELNGITTRIACCVGRTAFAALNFFFFLILCKTNSR